MTAIRPAREPYTLAVRLLAVVVTAVATVVFGVGWGLNVSIVRSVIPGAVAMKPQTALALTAGSIALLLLGVRRAAPRRAGLVLATVPAVLGAAVLSEY